MAGRVSIDGVVTAPEEARVGIFDRGFLYGDAVFETLRAYGGKAFMLDEHLGRLYASARRVRLTPPMALGDLALEVRALVRDSGLDDALVRLTLTRGEGARGLDPTSAGAARRILAVLPLVVDARVYEHGVGLVTATARLDPASPLAGVKHTNYLAAITAVAEARARGADDALFVDVHGRVAEATSANVFALLDEGWCTPPLTTGILGGMTRQALLGLLGDEARERELVAQDLHAARAVVLTSSLREVVPVVRLDGIAVAGGVVPAAARHLLARYREHVAQALA